MLAHSSVLFIRVILPPLDRNCRMTVPFFYIACKNLGLWFISHYHVKTNIHATPKDEDTEEAQEHPNRFFFPPYPSLRKWLHHLVNFLYSLLNSIEFSWAHPTFWTLKVFGFILLFISNCEVN